VLCTTFWGLVALPTMAVDRSGEGVIWIGRRWIHWILAGCGVHVEATGTENVDRERPQVFMSNHQSVWDIAAIIVAIPVSFRFVAKKEVLALPFVGWAAKGGGHVIVDRGDNAQAVASLKRAAARIRDGTNVIIYPEGTRSESGRMRGFKSGGFHLAIEAGVPVVPVTVSGSHRLTPKRSLRIRSGTVRIHFGKPIATHGLTVEDRYVLKERVREAMVAGFDPALQGPETLDGAPADH
jgi:1-acyl-sn-glycerol-3-phosphate acyltransferase